MVGVGFGVMVGVMVGFRVRVIGFGIGFGNRGLLGLGLEVLLLLILFERREGHEAVLREEGDWSGHGRGTLCCAAAAAALEGFLGEGALRHVGCRGSKLRRRSKPKSCRTES